MILKRHSPVTAAEALGSLCRTAANHGHALRCGGMAARGTCTTGGQIYRLGFSGVAKRLARVFHKARRRCLNRSPIVVASAQRMGFRGAGKLDKAIG